MRTLLEHHGHRVESPDLPGAPGAAPVTLEAVADAASEALLQLAEPAVIVAHSMGGMAAVMAADRHRDRVAGLVCAAAVVPRPGVSVLHDSFGWAGSLAMGALGRHRPIRPAAAWLLGHRLAPAERRALLARLRTEDLSRAGRPFPDYTLAGLRCVYVLTARDRLLRPATQARFAARLPGARAVIVDGGHSVPLEHPAVVTRVAEALQR